MDELSKLRNQIDEIDLQILRLLNERARLAKAVGDIKKSMGLEVHSPEREQEVFSRLSKLNKELFNESFPTQALRYVYREIMSACLSLEEVIKVAYLGPRATFTHQASLEFFGLSAKYVAVGTIEDVFKEVELSRADYGVVPIENTTEGVVNFTLDRFLQTELKIVGEVVIPIRLNLLSRSSEINNIEAVFSHRHAIAQCREWLSKNLPNVKIFEAESTARACEIASESQSVGAIASEAAAHVYHLNILSRNIQDNPDNYTRFIVVGKRAVGPTGKDKTTIAFALKDQTGALYRALECFYEEQINLTRIVSRPNSKRVWDYIFFVDFEGHFKEEHVERVIHKLKERAQMVKVLGSYPMAPLKEGKGL
ncbi:MAG: prephenate dehydratase [Aquificaceae bacterium]|nr:prephenate dehydratase [Aquificaceae bacterium]